MLQGDALVFTGIVYSVGLFVFGFFVGKRNGSKVDPTALEARISALEEKALADLKAQLATAKANTNSAVSAVKQAVADVKPENVAQAIVTEIKKGL